MFLDTGVEALEQRVLDGTGLLRPADGGFGTRPDGGFGELDPLPTGALGNGRFNSPSLIEFADTPPAFHGHLTAKPGSGLPDTVEGAIQFYTTPEFRDATGGLDPQLTPRDIADIGRLLRVLNALENLRTVDEYAARALPEALERPRADTERRLSRLLELARLETEDALKVLGEVGLHPEVVSELRAIDAQLQGVLEAHAAARIETLRQVRVRLGHARALLAG